ncbi:hypothetical protein [uncultured Draconibacterium sp.]|uniref:hypothetical protein n=1 Tax=uncultured Draconibacterium sp. TaxID=1573823 RepID=UPI003217ACF1
MEYSINLPQIEKDTLKLVVPQFFGKPKLVYNNIEIPKLNNRYAVNGNNETPYIFALKNNFFDPVPKVEVNNQALQIVQAIKWYEYLWMGLPIVLIFQGGLIGALLGFFASRINISIFRNNKKQIIKYLFTLGISLFVICAYLIIVLLLTEAVNA